MDVITNIRQILALDRYILFLVIRMKKKIKKVCIPIFLSVICGFLCGRVLFGIYEDKGNSILESDVIYLLEDTEYDNYDEMKAKMISESYVYYEEDGKYNAVIAMTKDLDNVEKIEDAYNKKLKVSEYLLNNDDINSKIDEYDQKIKEAAVREEVWKITTELIDVYKDYEDIKMVKIS